MTNPILHIQKDRMLNELQEQGKIGWKDKIGLCREGYSDSYFQVRDYVKELMEKAGLEVRIDTVGNIFGCLKGSNSSAKTILIGSHLDSVYGGGIYDGQFGVFGAIEAVRTLKENGVKPIHNIEIVGFVAEEGGPLGGTFGSRCFCGLVDLDKLSTQILETYGLTKQKILDAKADLSKYLCFLEMHIEQGPVLDRDSIYKLGIPTGIVGILRYRCSILGEANHAGTTPMLERKDALYQTFQVLTQWIGKVREEKNAVCNVAQIKNEPDQIGVVSERTEFLIEIRSQEEEHSLKIAADLEELLKKTEGYTMEQVINKRPVVLNEALMKFIEDAADKLSVANCRMPSGASHDAASLGKVMPTAMIFVPSKNGISHNKEEYTTPEELTDGTEVLCNTLLSIDEEYSA